MSFGSELSNEFIKLTHANELNEVELFTKLEDAIINLSAKYPMCIEIIHGSKSFVDFQCTAKHIEDSSLPALRKCELSDIMFITFSNNKDKIRLTYMQNKLGKDWNHFYIDLVQFDLLKYKPEIQSKALPLCLFGNKDILSTALLPSVTTYGVFYKNGSSYDMSYFSSQNVNPRIEKGKSQKRIAKRSKKAQEKAVNQITGYFKNGIFCSEIQSTKTLEDFANALFNMQIGTPITKNNPSYNAIHNFLRAHSRTFTRNDINEENFKQVVDLPTICIINSDYTNFQINNRNTNLYSDVVIE